MTGRVQINRDDLLRTGDPRLKERAPRKRTAQHRAGDLYCFRDYTLAAVCGGGEYGFSYEEPNEASGELVETHRGTAGSGVYAD